MDNSKELLGVLSLCTGYGGLELGIERVLGDIRVLAHVEIEAFAIANLVNKMETNQLVPAPIWTDLKTLPLEPFRNKVDILTGGYPCQPFSAAGKRKGADDPRHLWPHIKRIIKGCRPVWCFFENVEGHISLGLSSVISDLEEMGYSATWGIFSAAEVGAPHQRKRVFILAHDACTERRSGIKEADEYDGSNRRWEEANGGSEPRSKELGNPESNNQRRSAVSAMYWERIENRRPSSDLWPARPGEEQYEWEAPRVVGNPLRGGRERSDGAAPEQSGDRKDNRVSTQNGEYNHGQTQPQLGRTVDGAIDRVDRLRLLGNGVVPQTAEIAFRTLLMRFVVLNNYRMKKKQEVE